MANGSEQTNARRDNILDRLTPFLVGHVPALDAGSLRYLASGLEADVFAGRRLDGHRLVFKVPPARWIDNDNDSGLDARELLHQEMTLSNHCRAHGFPAPAVHDVLHCNEETSVLVADFVEHDGGACDDDGFGAVLGRLHELPVPDYPFAALRGESVEETLASLIAARAAVVLRLGRASFHVPDVEELRQATEWSGARRALLHMDARPANFLSKGGRVVGVIDWANALIADPMLELMRVAEYGLLGDGVRRGYEREARFSSPPARVELCYRLYSATMLAVVFLSEQPDEERGRAAASRVAELFDRLRRA